jgi:hypothetical protein
MNVAHVIITGKKYLPRNSKNATAFLVPLLEMVVTQIHVGSDELFVAIFISRA